MDCFETASFPGVSEKEKRRLLHFVVVGGGPTGVEFAGELYDYLKEDLRKYYGSVADFAKITLVQSADHLLNTYSEKISQMTSKRFLTDYGIQVLTNARVVKVDEQTLTVFRKETKQEVSERNGSSSAFLY